MLSYHRGTWRAERDDPLPAVAALDVFCKRYSWSFEDYMATPVDVIEELLQVISAEVEVENERQEEQEQELARQRAAAGLPPLPRRGRTSRTPGISAVEEARAGGLYVPPGMS